MNSPRASSVPAKRSRVSLTPTNRGQTDGHGMGPLDQLLDNHDMPPYMRFVVEVLVETRRELVEIHKRNDAMMEENRKLREENSLLKIKIDQLLLRSANNDNIENVDSSGCIAAVVSTPVAQSIDSAKEDPDLKRSIIVSGIPESRSNSAYERMNHDYNCVNTLLDFLGIECFPKTVYRMGRPDTRRPRILKVILPTSRFQRETLRRKSQLRFFTHKGVFIRPSLTKEVRERRRNERLSGVNPSISQNCSDDSVNSYQRHVDSSTSKN